MQSYQGEPSVTVRVVDRVLHGVLIAAKVPDIPGTRSPIADVFSIATTHFSCTVYTWHSCFISGLGITIVLEQVDVAKRIVSMSIRTSIAGRVKTYVNWCNI